jgi:excisionase family DNA binding protein
MTIISGRTFTTFEVAKICGVFHTTVINWVNKGKMKAHCTPGGHRRILLPDLIDFMTRFDMPIPGDLTYRPKKILVVEDDPSVQRLLKRVLQALPDVEIQTCVGGLEALMSIGKGAPDLLILDIRIPQVNGIEVCQLLRSNEQTRPIKIIAITGEPLADESQILIQSLVNAFFQKPLPIAELRAKARELLELEEAPNPVHAV